MEPFWSQVALGKPHHPRRSKSPVDCFRHESSPLGNQHPNGGGDPSEYSWPWRSAQRYEIYPRPAGAQDHV